MKKVIILGLIALCGFLCGCNLLPGGPPPADVTYVPINPEAPEDQSQRESVTLYYRFSDTEYLSTETREIPNVLDEPFEMSVAKELLKGPSISRPELKAIFPVGTSVRSVTMRDNQLYVTLSNEFLDPPAEWQDNDYWKYELPRRRLLALQSLTNTLTGLGGCSQMQIQMDFDAEQPRWVPKTTIDADETDETAVIEAMEFAPEVVLNPGNTLREVLAALIEADPAALFRDMVLKNQVVLGTVNAGPQAFAAAIADLQTFHLRWPDAVAALMAPRTPIDQAVQRILSRPAAIKSIISFPS